MSLSKVARLDTCVTMIDALNFLNRDLPSTDSLKDRGTATSESKCAIVCLRFNNFELLLCICINFLFIFHNAADDRSIGTLLLEQVEFADVVVINKTDLVAPEQVRNHRSLSLSHPYYRLRGDLLGVYNKLSTNHH